LDPMLYATQAGGPAFQIVLDLEEILSFFQCVASLLCPFVRANEEEGRLLLAGGSADGIAVSEDLDSLRLCLLGDLLEKAKRWNDAHSTVLSMPPLSAWSLSNVPPNGSQFEFDDVKRKMPPLKKLKELTPTLFQARMPSQFEFDDVFIVFIIGGNGYVSLQRGDCAQLLKSHTH
jgi:hypothetical protein